MPENCPRCGSEKVMEDVHLNTDPITLASQQYRHRLVAYVHKNPDAWVFKGTVFAVLRARVCGGCGHAEIYTPEFAELYAAYQKARGG